MATRISRSPRHLGATLAAAAAISAPSPALADAAPGAPPELAPERRPAFEVNVLWPFIGISELKAILPVWGGHHLRGELVFGLYLDFAHWLVRPNNGPTAIVNALTGYRQFFGYGFHAEATLATGWRHEDRAPPDGSSTYNDFYMRLWVAAGWQYEWWRVYVNLRPRVGFLIERYPNYALEKKVVPAGDVNLGIRF
jgi:hypothetical protein